MKANEFLTAQEALWLAKVIFDQTYNVLNASLQKRSEEATQQTVATKPKPAVRTRLVVMPSAKAPSTKPRMPLDKLAAQRATTTANQVQAKPQPRSYAAIRPRKPSRPQ